MYKSTVKQRVSDTRDQKSRVKCKEFAHVYSDRMAIRDDSVRTCKVSMIFECKVDLKLTFKT